MSRGHPFTGGTRCRSALRHIVQRRDIFVSSIRFRPNAGAAEIWEYSANFNFDLISNFHQGFNSNLTLIQTDKFFC